MSERFTNEPMLDMFIFETSQLTEQLEQSILASDESSCYTKEAINEIFRIMHTIKGSSAMMMFSNISTLAHTIEDLFYFIREEKPQKVDCSTLSDLILEGVDFIKLEVEKIKNRDCSDGDASALIKSINDFLIVLKQNNFSKGSMDSVKQVKQAEQAEQAVHNNTEKHRFNISHDKVVPSSYKNAFKAVIYFEEGCEMENIRAYTIIHNLKDITDELFYTPEDIIDNDKSIETIRREGFTVYLKADCSYSKMYEFFMRTIFLKDIELIQLENDDDFKRFYMNKRTVVDKSFDNIPSLPNQCTGNLLEQDKENNQHPDKEILSAAAQQSIISVSVAKLDKLMDLVGEMVISESMVIQNPDLKGLELVNFQKAARQLHKITSEMQDTVMSIRMVPLSATFLKMHRIVRDMCKKLGKEVQLKIAGEETEVDKNVIEHISDPLMHLVRNALDHGIESPEDRVAKGKSETGTIILEAKNAGSDVLVIVKDDGKGLDKDKILKKAKKNGLLYKSEEEMSDKEIFNLIFLPGFSTNESVTEFSGRGVGMDVVVKNIETIGGSVSMDSTPDKGSAITLKIPLTLAIIDGMNISVGTSRYTIPTISIKESFRPKENDVFSDPEGNEMIMVRGQCYPVLRLRELFKLKTGMTDFTKGIIIMIEQDDITTCIFADELIGQQQVVVKALPEYIQSFKKTKGLAGCTLLGDGSISLILDIAGLGNK